MIQRRHYPKYDLVIHIVVGNLDEQEFREAGIALYEMDPPPLLSLWDLSNASVSELTATRMRVLQAEFAGSVSKREGGKTAVVAPRDFAFGVGRQYKAYAEAHGLPIEHQIFRTAAEAFAWLEVDVDLLDQPGEEGAAPA